MTLQKAIEILANYIGTGPEAEPVDFDSAIALGIEAQKRVMELRVNGKPDRYSILPGETKEYGKGDIMTPPELARLKNYDKRPLHALSGEERLEYIMLLRKLRHETQLSLDLATAPPPYSLLRSHPV